MEGIESNNFKRKRWNLLGFIASVISTFALIGLILYYCCPVNQWKPEIVTP